MEAKLDEKKIVSGKLWNFTKSSPTYTDIHSDWIQIVQQATIYILWLNTNKISFITAF